MNEIKVKPGMESWMKQGRQSSPRIQQAVGQARAVAAGRARDAVKRVLRQDAASDAQRAGAYNDTNTAASSIGSSSSNTNPTSANPASGNRSQAFSFSQPVSTGGQRSYQTAGNRTLPKEKPSHGIKLHQWGLKHAYGAVKNAANSATSSAASVTSRTVVNRSNPSNGTADMVAEKSKQAAQKLAKTAAQKSAKLAAKVVKKLAKEIVKALAESLKALAAAVGVEATVIAIVVVVLAAVAFVILSTFGIFTGGGGNGTPTISAAVQTLNGELTARIEQIKKSVQADTVNVIYNGNEDNAFIDNWPDILAVYAVETNMDPNKPMDVVVMDDQRIALLRKVFWDMTLVDSYVTEQPNPSPSPEATADSSAAPTATPEPKEVLNIEIHSRYWDDMIEDYQFSDKQVAILKQMMGAKLYSMLLYLASGKPATDWSDIIDLPEGGMDIPLYLQGDYKQTVCYIDGVAKSVSTSGCGATSVSMVIAYLTGDTSQTPYTLFKWAYDHDLYSGDGLSHGCLTRLCSFYGVKGTWIANDATMITEALRAGHPVVAHMGPGIFTNEGHYIVLRGITEDGYVLVNDPGSKRRSRYAYKLSVVVEQARREEAFMVCETEQ